MGDGFYVQRITGSRRRCLEFYALPERGRPRWRASTTGNCKEPSE